MSISTVVPLPRIGADGVPDPTVAPVSAYRYLDARRRLIETEAKQRPLIRLWDKNMRYIGTVANEKSLDVERMLHDTGTGQLVLHSNDWIVDFLRTDVRAEEDLHLTIDPYPNRRSWRWRWGGKVNAVKVSRGEDGIKTVTLEVSENREHLKHLLLGATPFCAPEVQPLKAWILPGNTRTIIATSIFVNLARLFWPILALPVALLDPFSWVDTRLGNMNPLNWPIQMQFVAPFRDQSRLSVLMARWSDVHSVTEALLKDAGCDLRVYTWLEEDTDSPHPELADLIGQKLARPTRNCLVVSCTDDSGVTGPTGTALDGALNLIAATLDDGISAVYFSDTDGDGVADPLVRKWFGLAPKVPDISFRDTEQSAIVSSEHAMYKSKAKHIMTGGRSPGWVNQLQTYGIRYAISQIAMTITTGTGQDFQNPGTEGLDNIYQGQLDDILLAYIRHTDPVRALKVGEYGYQEHWEQGSGSAWTVSSTLTLRQGHAKTRPYQAFKVRIRNGRPNMVYYDFDLGSRCHFEIDNVFYTDQITAIRLHYDADTPKTFDLSVGDDTESEDPIARVTRTAQNLWNGLAMMFGSENLF